MTAHDDLNAAVSAAQAEYKKAASDLLACQTKLDSTTHELQTAQAALAQAQLDLKACQDAAKPPASDFQVVPLGANLQAVLKEAGTGAKLQLPATLKFAGTVTPLPGQHLRGPCVITPVNLGGPPGFGFNCKTNDAINTTFESLDVSGFGLRGLVPWYGSLIKGGHYHYNGEMGCGFDGEGAKQEACTYDGVEIDHNGKAEFLGHGASGIKHFHVWKTVVKNCHVYDNMGNNVWGDFNCGDFIVTDNTLTGALRKAVFYEKCGASGVRPGDPTWDAENGLVVTGNTITGNGKEGGASDAGVAAISSKHVLIENNVFGNAGKHIGIYIRDDPNRLDPGKWDGKIGFHPSDVVIGKNTMNGDKTVGCDLPGVTC